MFWFLSSKLHTHFTPSRIFSCSVLDYETELQFCLKLSQIRYLSHEFLQKTECLCPPKIRMLNSSPQVTV